MVQESYKQLKSSLIKDSIRIENIGLFCLLGTTLVNVHEFHLLLGDAEVAVFYWAEFDSSNTIGRLDEDKPQRIR